MRKSKNFKPESESRMIENPSVKGRIADTIIILFCALIGFCCFIPLWHVTMSALSDGQTLLKHEGLVLWPVGNATLDGFKLIFKDASIVKGYANSLIYTFGSTALGFFIAVTGGYALSKTTKLQTVMILFCTITLLFGGGLVPTYMVIRRLGMVGSRWSLIIPGCTNSMFAIMMMNSFKGVPKEYEEAAKIDGAGHFRTLFQVMLPQAMNMGSVLILNSIVGQWNAWFNASIYVPNNRDAWPLQLWIRQIQADNANFLQTSNPDYSRYLIQFALIVAATLPVIVLFPFFQNKLEKGVITGGVKG